MILNNNSSNSAVFSESASFNNSPLKKKDALREAVIINELSRLPANLLREFVSSPEAKVMLEEEIISYDTMESLSKDTYKDRAEELVVTDIAYELKDERMDELFRLRSREREIMNSLMRDYSESAAPYVEMYRENFINKYVPKHFQSGK